MHPDIPDEQAYFDRALDLRERLEANLGRAASLAADPKTAAELRRRVGALGVVDPGVAVAFGRIDVRDTRWYIGKRAIWDEDDELVVVNWQAPIAAPFYSATPSQPEGLDARRIYRCEDNRILDIEEMVFNGLEQAVLGGPARANGASQPKPTHIRDAGANAVVGTNGAPAATGVGGANGMNGNRRTSETDTAENDLAFNQGAPGGTDDDDTEPGVVEGGRADRHGDDRADPDATGPGDVPVSDALLATLNRARSGELGDIVATIQAAQYDIITRDVEQLLVVQGGPGTGKTVVGLHRVSWMLYHRRERWQANDILIVGPNPAFIRYISAVLPSLGEEAVVQLPVAGLGPRVKVKRTEPVEVRRLKGDRRMLRLLLRAVRKRQRPQRGPIDVKVAGRTVRIDGDRIVARAQQLAGQPHNEAGRELRSFVIDEIQTFFTRRGLRGLAAIEDMVQSEATREIDRYMDRIWPTMTPQGFVVELFSIRRRLEAAGVGLLTGEEIDMLSIPAGTKISEWSWSIDDVPLLDMADALLNGTPATYEHIVVDEAQDLSPMQFESIRRRSRTGGMTVLGDLAQATSPWSPGSWEEVVLHLRRDRVPAEIAELTIGYRLPQEVHDVAMRLLPEIAPRLKAPDAVRPSGHEVTVTATRAGDLAGAVVEAVRRDVGTGLVGVVTGGRERAAVTEALDAAGLRWAPELQARATPIVVLAPEDAKGLEFDNVVVVEPARIAEESPQGLRALFVALTRSTSRLTLVHADPLLDQLGLDSPGSPPELDAPGEAQPLAGPAGPEPEPPQATERESTKPSAALPAAAQAAALPATTEPATAEPAPEEPPPSAETSPASAASPAEATQPAAATESAPEESQPPAPEGPAGSSSSPALPVNVASIQGEALVALDRAMARAIAGQLADTLARYVTPTLVPLVLEEMGQRLQQEQESVRVIDVRDSGN